MDTSGRVAMYEACLMHARADRALRSVVAQELGGMKITMMEWLALGVICDSPSEGHSMSAVATALDVTQPQVTALMTNLLKHRLAKQKTQKADRRSRHVIPTAKGRDILRRIEAKMTVTLREWLGDVPEDQLQAYIATVEFLAGKNL